MTCPDCGREAELVSGKQIYPHWPDLGHKMFYLCVACESFVGCHPGTDKPLGTLANAELREARQHAHKLFDPLWEGGKMSRGRAYRWLSKKLGVKEAHIGESDLETCRRIVEICEREGL